MRSRVSSLANSLYNLIMLCNTIIISQGISVGLCPRCGFILSRMRIKVMRPEIYESTLSKMVWVSLLKDRKEDEGKLSARL